MYMERELMIYRIIKVERFSLYNNMYTLSKVGCDAIKKWYILQKIAILLHLVTIEMEKKTLNHRRQP